MKQNRNDHVNEKKKNRRIVIQCSSSIFSKTITEFIWYICIIVIEHINWESMFQYRKGLEMKIEDKIYTILAYGEENYPDNIKLKLL